MILAFVLSSAYSSLEDITYNNIQADIKKNILSSLGFTPSNEDPWTTEKVEQIFNESIVSFVINKSGNVIPDKLPEDLDPKVDTDLYPIHFCGISIEAPSPSFRHRLRNSRRHSLL